MLLCTLSQGQLLHPVHGFGLGYAQMSVPKIFHVRTKASSLSETGDHQGSIWQLRESARRSGDEKRPIMQASFRSFGRNGQTRYIPSSASLSPSLFGSVTLPLPATLSSPVSHLFFTLTAGWER